MTSRSAVEIHDVDGGPDQDAGRGAPRIQISATGAAPVRFTGL